MPSARTQRSSSQEPLLRNRRAEENRVVSHHEDSISRHSAPHITSEATFIDVNNAKGIKKNLLKYEELFRLDENVPNQPTTTRRELWSYYLYYNGDNGVGPGAYSQALFQSAVTHDGWDPNISPIQKGNCGNAGCVVGWGTGTRSVASVVLVANGICFAIMTIIFVIFGSAADYGSFGRWLLLSLTIVCWIFQYAMTAIKDPSQWPTAMLLYIISYISYGATLVFYAAVFPRLARYMPHVRKARDEDFKDGKINQEEYEDFESLERNHISSISTAHSNIGYLVTLGLNIPVLLSLQGKDYANNVALGLTNTYWVVLGIWWFIFQQPRPGPKMPKGSSYATIGFKQVVLAVRETAKLPQTFTFLVAFFLLADGLNTTGTLVGIIQNSIVKFSFLEITYLGLSQAICSIISTFGFWYFQQYFKIKTKHMFMLTNLFSVLIPFYGMLGLWTNVVGYHNIRDFWIYNIVFGLFQAPYYAYSQAMMSEVTPRGYENMFFGLFGITNRASSIIGPNVLQAIINSTNNNWMGFPFLFSLCACASVVIWFVDVEKARENCRTYLADRNLARVAHETDEIREASYRETSAEDRGVDSSNSRGTD